MTVREILAQQNPGALLYDERYDAALVGFTVGFGAKRDPRPVAVYDRDRLVAILAAEFADADRLDGAERDEGDLLDDAAEWLISNMAHVVLGPDAPVIVAME
jgi:hypothetical protein